MIRRESGSSDGRKGGARCLLAGRARRGGVARCWGRRKDGKGREREGRSVSSSGRWLEDGSRGRTRRGGQGQRGSEAPWHGASGQVMPLGNAREEKPAGRSVPFWIAPPRRLRRWRGDRHARGWPVCRGEEACSPPGVVGGIARVSHRTLLPLPAMVEGEWVGGPASRQTSHGAHPARLSSRSLLSRPHPLVLFPQPPTTRTR